jgi:hypothetical protein
MLKAAGLKIPEGRTVLLLANPAIGESVEQYFRLADLYASVEVGVAERFVAAWRRPGEKATPRYEPVLEESTGSRKTSVPSIKTREEAGRVSKTG